MNPIDLHSGYTWAWIIILVQIVVVEAIALVRESPGDTATEHVRWMMFEHQVIPVLVAVGILWLFWHFVVQTFQ